MLVVENHPEEFSGIEGKGERARSKAGQKRGGARGRVGRYHFESDWMETEVGLRSLSFFTKLSPPAAILMAKLVTRQNWVTHKN